MEALHDLVRSGKVRYIGASSMWAVRFAQMQFVAEKNGWTKFISMQNRYNLLYREEEREMNRFCNDTGVGLIPVRLSLTSHDLLYPELIYIPSGLRLTVETLPAHIPSMVRQRGARMTRKPV
jgi:hypothetical protein